MLISELSEFWKTVLQLLVGMVIYISKQYQAKEASRLLLPCLPTHRIFFFFLTIDTRQYELPKYFLNGDTGH